MDKTKLQLLELIVIVVFLVFIVIFYPGKDDPVSTPNYSHVTTPTPEAKEEEKIIIPSVPFPANGTILEQSFSSIASDQESILRIETSGEAATLVKMEYNTTKETLLIIFIKPGQSIELSIPAGTYIMKASSGEKWYGAEIMFGEEGSYSQMEGLQVFEPNDFWTYELIPQYGGNLGEKNIDQSDF